VVDVVLEHVDAQPERVMPLAVLVLEAERQRLAELALVRDLEDACRVRPALDADLVVVLERGVQQRTEAERRRGDLRLKLAHVAEVPLVAAALERSTHRRADVWKTPCCAYALLRHPLLPPRMCYTFVVSSDEEASVALVSSKKTRRRKTRLGPSSSLVELEC
jgi:hypothetical protein